MSAGKLKIHVNDGDPNENKKDLVQPQPSGRTQQSQQQQQQQGQQPQPSNISDDEGDVSSHEVEVSFSGLDATKVCHLFKTELKNFAVYYHAKVTRDPPEGSVKKVTIKVDEKYAKDLEDKVEKMQEDLKGLSEEVVQLDVTKVDKVKDIVKQYQEGSGVLVYINPMARKVHVVAGDYEKFSQVLHQVKVALGLISVSTRAGRQMVTSSQSDGRNNLYPSLPSGSGNDKVMPGGHRSEEDMETEDYEDRNQRVSNTRDGDQRSGEQSNRDRGGRGAYGRNTDRGDQYGRSDGEDFKFIFSFPSGFVLKVYKASIIKLDVDAIVNAANDNLVHGGGVAAVISKAAGWSLDEESRQYVKEHGLLKVGQNCLTYAGNLPYKSVIHAVGPQWHDYSGEERKKECLVDLYKTVYEVLKTAEKEMYRTVAMSAISAGIYAVPKELCADMYVLATADFAEKNMRFLKELHITDIDVSILKSIEESCRKFKEDPESIGPVTVLRQYMKDHAIETVWTSQRHGYGRGRRAQRLLSDPGGEMSKLSEEFEGLSVKKETTDGGYHTVFIVNDSVKVHIYTGKIDEVKYVSAVVCSTDHNFGTSGFVVSAFREAFGETYRYNFKKMTEKENYRAKLGYVYTCATRSVYAPYVMHLAMSAVLTGQVDELRYYKIGIGNIFNRAERRNFDKIAVPLLGTGNVRNKPDVLKSCGKCVLEALKDFCQGKSKHLMEVHLVNNTEDITNMLRDVFEEAERATKSGAYQKPKTGASRKAVTSFQEKSSRDGGHFFETMNETRTHESFRSNVTEDKESDGFDNSAKSRMYNKKDSKTLDLSKSVTPSASNVPAREEGVKKKVGNLRIFDDAAL